MLSTVAVITHSTSLLLYSLLEAYFMFAIYVIASGLLIHFVGERIPRKFEAETGFFSAAAWEDN